MTEHRVPSSKVISSDGDIPLIADCSECDATFDAGQEHTVEANYAELQRKWERHCREKHPIKA